MKKKIASLEDLLTHELKDLYNAETQLIKNLPILSKAADSEDLRSVFAEHLEATRGHAQRIEQISQNLKFKPRGKKCLGMAGLIEEGKELLNTDVGSATLEASLIGAAQKVAHYEIAAYGTAAAHAQQLGLVKVAEVLNQMLSEEKDTDQRLTHLAQNKVNVQAASQDDHGADTQGQGSTGAAVKAGAPEGAIETWQWEGGGN